MRTVSITTEAVRVSWCWEYYSSHGEPRIEVDDTKMPNTRYENQDKVARGDLSRHSRGVRSASSVFGDAESSDKISNGGSTKNPVDRNAKRKVKTREAVFERHMDGLKTKFDKAGKKIVATIFNKKVVRHWEDEMDLLNILPRGSIQATRNKNTWWIDGTRRGEKLGAADGAVKDSTEVEPT